MRHYCIATRASSRSTFRYIMTWHAASWELLFITSLSPSMASGLMNLSQNAFRRTIFFLENCHFSPYMFDHFLILFYEITYDKEENPQGSIYIISYYISWLLKFIGEIIQFLFSAFSWSCQAKTLHMSSVWCRVFKSNPVTSPCQAP